MRIREVTVRYRPSSIPLTEAESYRNSRQIFEAFKEIALEPVEVFLVLYLDGKNRMLFFEEISGGSLTSALVHPSETDRDRAG